eukprot:1605766-Amphidinium_carterae.1
MMWDSQCDEKQPSVFRDVRVCLGNAPPMAEALSSACSYLDNLAIELSSVDVDACEVSTTDGGIPRVWRGMQRLHHNFLLCSRDFCSHGVHACDRSADESKRLGQGMLELQKWIQCA